MIFFFILRKNQKQKISAIGIIESQNKEWWSVSYATCVDIMVQVSLTQWSIFLFLDVLTLKLGVIIIIILLTDPSEIILPTAHTTKN